MNLKQYFITSIVFALIALPFIIIVRHGNYKKERFNIKEAAILLFFMTLSVILFQTLLPYQWIYGDFISPVFHSPDFTFYKTFPKLFTHFISWKLDTGEYDEIIVNIFGNIAIFIPIGLTAPVIWKNLKSKSILIGLSISCFVEFIQLFTDRNSDYNDIVLNVIGTSLGYLLFLLIKYINNKKKQGN